MGKQELRLAPKEVGVLEHLMRHAGELVEYDALQEAVWGQDAIVGPGALYECVSNIRQALGDDAARPRWIQTVSGAGYRFVAPVEVLP
jgi:DNA-binding winged helix-turn-helix (wHTH) protein